MDSEAESYRRFLDGDDSGLKEIIDGCYDGLVLYLNTYVRDLSSAEELAEDTFVKLATKKPGFSGRSSFKTWLYAVGRNIALDYLRRRSKQRTVPADSLSAELSADAQIEQDYLKEEQKIALHRAMNSLKTEYRQVLWLAYFEDMSMSESARVMGRIAVSAEHLLRRAKQALRAQLEKEDIVL